MYELSIENETSFLKEYFNVEVLYFSNNIFIATQILNFFFNKNFFAERKIFNKIEEFNPEIVYFHNTWFNIWNNVFLKLSEIADIQIFLKLHNYRFHCTKTYSTKTHLEGSKICKGCGGDKRSLKYFNKYFEGSYLKSFLVNYYGKRYYKILKNENIISEGKNIVVIGRSNIVGKPMVALLSGKSENATVTVCHSKTINLEQHTVNADIIIVAVGKPNVLDGSMVKKGVIVIDVGINRIENKENSKGFSIVGDVEFNSISKKASLITPVPGGVGPMTIAMLMKNVCEAAKLNI